MRVLRARLLQAERSKQTATLTAERRASIGTAERNERIRTYNYPQVRADPGLNQVLYCLLYTTASRVLYTIACPVICL